MRRGVDVLTLVVNIINLIVILFTHSISRVGDRSPFFPFLSAQLRHKMSDIGNLRWNSGFLLLNTSLGLSLATFAMCLLECTCNSSIAGKKSRLFVNHNCCHAIIDNSKTQQSIQ